MVKIVPFFSVAQLGLRVTEQVLSGPGRCLLATQHQAQLLGAEGAQAALREHGGEAATKRLQLARHAPAQHPLARQINVLPQVGYSHL